MLWKLDALQSFIHDLHWPEEVFGEHLDHRLKLMAADMIEAAAKRYFLFLFDDFLFCIFSFYLTRHEFTFCLMVCGFTFCLKEYGFTFSLTKCGFTFRFAGYQVTFSLTGYGFTFWLTG